MYPHHIIIWGAKEALGHHQAFVKTYCAQIVVQLFIACSLPKLQ